MPQLQHFTANAEPPAMLEAIRTDGAIIVDQLVGPELIEALRAQTDPYMDASENGRDDFSGSIKTLRSERPALRIRRSARFPAAIDPDEVSARMPEGSANWPGRRMPADPSTSPMTPSGPSHSRSAPTIMWAS